MSNRTQQLAQIGWRIPVSLLNGLKRIARWDRRTVNAQAVMFLVEAVEKRLGQIEAAERHTSNSERD